MMKCVSCGEGLYTEAEAGEYLGLKKRIRELEDVLSEVALEPYADSDLKSLHETLRSRARTVLASKDKINAALARGIEE